jgi:hypothetical protein
MDIEALITEAKDLIEGVIRKHAPTIVPIIEDDVRRALNDGVATAMNALNDIAGKITALATPVPETAAPAEPAAPTAPEAPVAPAEPATDAPAAPAEPAAPKSLANPTAYGQG